MPIYADVPPQNNAIDAKIMQAMDIHSQYEKNVLDIINKQRTQNGSPPLNLSNELTIYANNAVNNIKNIGSISTYNRIYTIENLKNDLYAANLKCFNTQARILSSDTKLSAEDIAKKWLSKKSNNDILLNSNMTHFAISYIDTEDLRSWCGLVIRKIEDNYNARAYEEEVIKLVNEERKNYNLPPLIISEPMMSASKIRAVEQSQIQGHTRPNKTSFDTVINDIKFQLEETYNIGENVASGQVSPKEVVSAWMNSPPHRENILSNKFDSIGVGMSDADRTVHWAQLFLKNG